jgi:hypothetical protein
LFHAEIETKIAYNVKQVLSGGREHHQDPAIGLLVNALSTSADWVELYVATGELEIVGLDKVGGELGDVVREVALVLFLDSGSDFDTHWVLYCRDLIVVEKVLYLLVESTTGDSLSFLSTFPSLMFVLLASPRSPDSRHLTLTLTFCRFSRLSRSTLSTVMDQCMPASRSWLK